MPPMPPEDFEERYKRMTPEEKEQYWKASDASDLELFIQIQIKETPHDHYVREQLDRGSQERAVHRFRLTPQPNSQKCSTEDCRNRKLPYSDKCNSCESD
jgi:hypothetical protein